MVPGAAHSDSLVGFGMLARTASCSRSADSAEPVMRHQASRIPTSPRKYDGTTSLVSGSAR